MNVLIARFNTQPGGSTESSMDAIALTRRYQSPTDSHDAHPAARCCSIIDASLPASLPSRWSISFSKPGQPILFISLRTPAPFAELQSIAKLSRYLYGVPALLSTKLAGTQTPIWVSSQCRSAIMAPPESFPVFPQLWPGVLLSFTGRFCVCPNPG